METKSRHSLVGVTFKVSPSRSAHSDDNYGPHALQCTWPTRESAGAWAKILLEQTRDASWPHATTYLFNPKALPFLWQTCTFDSNALEDLRCKGISPLRYPEPQVPGLFVYRIPETLKTLGRPHNDPEYDRGYDVPVASDGEHQFLQQKIHGSTEEQASWRASFAEMLRARMEEILGLTNLGGPASARALDELILRTAEEITAHRTIAQPKEIAEDPLQAARDRGRHHALAELARPENLSLRDAATFSGRSDRAINEARLKGQLYALVPPGKQRGLRYPQWQFDTEGDRLAAVLAPFIEAGASCWVVHNFMQRPHQALGDARPMDWILDVSKPVEPVVEAVKKRYTGEQGAA